MYFVITDFSLKITTLEAENKNLRARVTELEEKLGIESTLDNEEEVSYALLLFKSCRSHKCCVIVQLCSSGWYLGIGIRFGVGFGGRKCINEISMVSLQHYNRCFIACQSSSPVC